MTKLSVKTQQSEQCFLENYKGNVLQHKPGKWLGKNLNPSSSVSNKVIETSSSLSVDTTPIKDRNWEYSLDWRIESPFQIEPVRMINNEHKSPQTKDDEDTAARVIQNAVTNFLDKKSLLKHNKIFGFSKKPQNTAHDILKESSKKNLDKITAELGYLSNDEKEIIKIIESITVRYRHQTRRDLDQEWLFMASPDIRKRKMSYKDFQANLLYYALEFSKDFAGKGPLKKTHDLADFGPIAYLIREEAINKRPCFITLANIQNEHIREKNFYKDISQSENPSDSCHARYSRGISFTPEDCRSGIALYLIKELRNSEKYTHNAVDKIKTLIKTDTGENDNIQKIINSLMEPEAHIPRVLRTKGYRKNIRRDYNWNKLWNAEK